MFCQRCDSAATMLIISLGLFGVAGIIATAIHLYRTPVVKNVAPYAVRQRHVTAISINHFNQCYFFSFFFFLFLSSFYRAMH